MIEEMDTAVGMVLDKLDELELATEHDRDLHVGQRRRCRRPKACPTSNVPLRAGKGWMYEGGIRVPTIVRWPDVVKGRASECDDADYQHRLFSDTPGGGGRAGQTGAANRWREPCCRCCAAKRLQSARCIGTIPHYGNQGGAPASAVRDGKWKLIEWREDDALELYDLEADPSEKKIWRSRSRR